MKSVLVVSGICIILGIVDGRAQDIVVHVSGAEYVITDSRQRRSGINPILNQKYVEINNSYGVSSIDSEDPNVEPPDPVNEFMSHDPVDGTYHLSLYGTKLARYRLMIAVSRGPGQGEDFVFLGLIDSGGVQEYEFSYSSVPGIPFRAGKRVRLFDLRQDLDNSHKLGLLGGRSLYRELSNRVNQIEKRLGRKDSSNAYKELEKLDRELKKARKETVKHEERKQKPNRFVTAEAFGILNEDIDLLRSTISDHRRKDRKKH